MSNSYTKAAFDLTVTVAEADMLRRVIATVELIDDTEAGIDVREAHYTSLGPDFAALFPRSDEDPFECSTSSRIRNIPISISMSRSARPTSSAGCS